jgi:hypothetical protein
MEVGSPPETLIFSEQPATATSRVHSARNTSRERDIHHGAPSRVQGRRPIAWHRTPICRQANEALVTPEMKMQRESYERAGEEASLLGIPRSSKPVHSEN